MKIWFAYSEDDNAVKPDAVYREHAYSSEEITQAFADTAEVFNDKYLEMTEDDELNEEGN